MKNNTPLSYIEISKNNLIHNIKALRSVAKRGTRVIVAIKGNAYGHGQNEVAKILEPYADYFQVDGIEELKLLRTISQKKTLVLGYVQMSDLKKVMKLDCIVSVFSREQVSAISAVAKNLGLTQEIYLPIDAYLGREGFLEEEWPGIFSEIKKLKNIKLIGMYAHFANIEDTSSFTHAHKQIKQFQKAVQMAAGFGFKKLQTHISATSGLFVYEKNEGIHPLIRVGIGVYGLWPSVDIKLSYENNFQLKPVLSWKTKVAQVKTLPTGHTIGYGLTYITNNPTKIALIPQGYADGLSRSLSGKGYVLIQGTQCPILGRIAMNMCVVDISHLKLVQEGEEVVIIGFQGDLQISAEEVASLSGTINYEVTTKISPLVPRVIV